MSVDLAVLGSGAAGLTAATVAARAGLRVLLLEASPWVGGTTAISGGMVWLPANHLMQGAGMRDSLAAARQYLAATVPPDGSGDVLEAFLQNADPALRDLQTNGAVQLRPVVRYPDYHPERPGATAGGRVLESEPFDGCSLGAAFARLRPPLPEFTLFGGMMVSRADIPHLRMVGRSARSAWHVARLLARHARERLASPRGSTLVLGNALAGRLFRAALQAGVDVQTNGPAVRLVSTSGRVDGVALANGDVIRTARGVVLACGGISHDGDLRASRVPSGVRPLSATVPAGAGVSGARLALDVDARLSDRGTRQGLWVPASTFVRGDGSAGVYPHTVADRGKPGLIAVDRLGRRFANEAVSYHDFVQAQLRAGAVPAWLLCDRKFLWRYGLGRIKPFTLRIGPHVDAGYLHCAPTLEALARRIGIDAHGLEETVVQYNAHARRGEDPDWGRGSDIYQRHLGDVEHRPNPCVAPLDVPPYCAVQVHPADLGMAAGLVTDGRARVLGPDDRPIEGLWACGNDMQSVMNGAYPGPGITLGPALVFGWLAGRDAAA